jgi:hypothetical protein
VARQSAGSEDFFNFTGAKMTDDEKNWTGVFAGLAMLGLLVRSKDVVAVDEIVADAFWLGKAMATELRRISDGSSDE